LRIEVGNILPDNVKMAKFWKKADGKVFCDLCPHMCAIAPEKRGICGVRQNHNGTLTTLIYGKASSIHVDPIEKKPLFHFMPGEMALSLGSIGCNFRCLHCQNYSISQAKVEMFQMSNLSPEQVSEISERDRCRIISWTYNEPTIWHEFTFDSSVVAKERGLATTYVTNGYINEEPLREIAPFLDAMNIDVKAFKDEFYRKVCKAHLQPVLNTVELAHSLGIHVELTYLIIPNMNDSEDEIRDFAKWVSTVSVEIPVHFTRFHPDYMMTDIGPTPISTLDMAFNTAKKEGLAFVYLGNVPSDDRENTYCPDCGTLVIQRTGFRTNIVELKDGKCGKCGRSLNMIVR
jgi:pyruvate formate lyase activating enzyme